MKGVEALKPLFQELIDADGQVGLVECDGRSLRQPQIDRLAAGLVWIETVLKQESLTPERLDGVRGKGEDAERSLCLKPDQGLILNVKRPLEAAEVEVDTH